QQARRILEARAADWRGDRRGAPLDEADLTAVENGAKGMRGWMVEEKRLVEASREQRRSRRRRRRVLLVTLGATTVVCVLLLVVIRLAFDRAFRAEIAEGQRQAQVRENHRQLAWSNWNSGIAARDVEHSPVKSAIFLMRAFQYARLAGDDAKG